MFFDDLIISIGQFLNTFIKHYGWYGIAFLIALNILLFMLNSSIPSLR